MNIAFTFKNFEPSEHLKKYAARRFEKLGRFFPKADNSVMNVNMAVDKFRHKIEAQFAGDYTNITAMEQSSDMYATVDMVLDKLEAQLKKNVEKLKDKRRGVGGGKADVDIFSYQTSGEGSGRSISGVENFEPKPLHVDEAVWQLEQKGYEFLVFLNAETEKVSVIYRRSNGNYGLIEPGI